MKKRFVGVFLICTGIFLLLFSHPTITGKFISEKFQGNFGLSILSLTFVILGIVYLLIGKLERNLAREVLTSGAIITNPKKIKSIAKKMGYSLETSREGNEVYDEQGKIVTEIPRHKISKGTFYSIMKSLSSGESNFRKRNREAYS